MTEDARRLVFFVMEERLEGEGEICLLLAVIVLTGTRTGCFAGLLV